MINGAVGPPPQRSVRFLPFPGGANLKKLAILSVLIYLSLSVNEALGCRCSMDPNPTPEKIIVARLNALEKAAVVFTGEVVFLDRFTVKFKVDKIWKGKEAEEITMLTGTKDNGEGTITSSSCDYSFNKGEKYLVYAEGPPEELQTHFCSRTALLKYAEDEMKGLDEITPHKSVGVEPKDEGQSHYIRNEILMQAVLRARVTSLAFRFEDVPDFKRNEI